MIPPVIPANFFPEEDEGERISRWLILEQEAEEMRLRDEMALEEPQLPRMYVGCTNDDILWHFS